MNQLDYNQISKSISPYVHRTPILTSTYLNNLSGASLHFKCEQFQKMGAFKMRGASYALLHLKEGEKGRGVCTHSSGNHGQALALAGKAMGIRVTIVVPHNAPAVKLEAMRNYGAEIILCEPTISAREAAVEEFCRNTGATFIHPSNDKNVIIGQGTSAWELIHDTPSLDGIITPVGGGGLLAGTILSTQSSGQKIKVYAAEPENADDAKRSITSGSIEKNINPETIADGLRTHLGNVNFPIILQGVEDIITVTEEEILTSMKLLWERLKVVTEPSSAVVLAAILKKPDPFKNKRIGVILSGGNVDLAKLPFLI